LETIKKLVCCCERNFSIQQEEEDDEEDNEENIYPRRYSFRDTGELDSNYNE
jgi:hypothetical protein